MELSIFPIGTKEEVLALRLNPEMVPSCSERVGDANVGCSYYKTCRFRKYRDQIDGKKGPERFGYYKVLDVDTPWEVANGLVGMCYQIMQTEHPMMKQAEELGRAYSAFVEPGGTVRQKRSTKLHVTKDPGCQACQKNECVRMKDEFVDVVVEPYERPTVRFGREREHINSIKDEQSESIDFEARVGALAKKQAIDPRKHEPKDERPKGLGEQIKRAG